MIRTCDLYDPNVALYQLSYTPCVSSLSKLITHRRSSTEFLREPKGLRRGLLKKRLSARQVFGRKPRDARHDLPREAFSQHTTSCFLQTFLASRSTNDRRGLSAAAGGVSKAANQDILAALSQRAKTDDFVTSGVSIIFHDFPKQPACVFCIQLQSGNCPLHALFNILDVLGRQNLLRQSSTNSADGISHFLAYLMMRMDRGTFHLDTFTSKLVSGLGHPKLIRSKFRGIHAIHQVVFGLNLFLRLDLVAP